MNLQRREEIRAIAECPNDMHWAQEMRRAVADLFAHIDALEKTAAERVIARGAVIAPHTFGEVVNQVRDIANQHAGTEQLRERIAYALEPHFERDAGPIPADRELMRLVDELIRWHGLRPLDKRPDHAAVLVEAIKALRANQGGAAT